MSRHWDQPARQWMRKADSFVSGRPFGVKIETVLTLTDRVLLFVHPIGGGR
jgi:hypothetical protein